MSSILMNEHLLLIAITTTEILGKDKHMNTSIFWLYVCTIYQHLIVYRYKNQIEMPVYTQMCEL